MAILLTCGPHCGIRQNAEGTITREGHCDCPQCHDGVFTLMGPPDPGDDPGASRNVPMCERWYERAGDYRPWQPGRHQPHVIRNAQLVGAIELRPDAQPWPGTDGPQAVPGE